MSVLDAARSPATSRIVAMVTLAVALAVFSADALAVGAHNRQLAAEQEAGAARVAEISGTDLAAVRAALDDVDPAGRRVTPVVTVNPGNADASDTLAVVPESFRRVALFPGGGPSAALWDRLRVPDTDALEVTGRSLEVVVDSTLRSTSIDGSPTEVTVGVDLVDARGEPQHLALGRLAGPVSGQRLSRPVACGRGCTLVGLWVGTLPSATIRGSITLRDMATPDGTVVPLGPGTQWRAFKDAQDNAIAPAEDSSGDATGSLTLDVTGEGSSLLSLQHDWLPSVVPALVAGPLPPDSDGNRFTLSGLDGESQEAARTGTVARAPAAPPHVFVVNLDLLTRGRAPVSTDRIEVWFADADPRLRAQVAEALDEHGVAIATERTLAQVRQRYDESAAAWSLQLAVLVGIVALLIGVLVLVVSAVSSWRMRARDLAALRMSGVSPGDIRSMAVAAQVPALVVGIVAGALAGLAGAQLALPIVPLFAVPPEVSTLDLGTAWPMVALATVGAAVVLGLSSLLIGRALARRAHLTRLRETV